ncbi:MAG: hypothetical protein IRZ00_07590 [Gemmatimonadetes bacterium]|nr:hypothetical protein [Gemmatimonadota bacterium]
MGTLVIWGEDDHQNRAQALATTYAAPAQNVKTKPKKISGLTTLVFWGHGDPSAFCGLNSDAFVDLVTTWKKLNSGLETVEMLTCNARHRQGGHTDSFTEQVVTKLSRKLNEVRFRALPIATTPTGNTCQFSILKWHPASGTWAYIGATGADDKTMWAAATKLEDFMPPRGTHVGYVRALAAMQAFRAMTTSNPYAVKRGFDQAACDKYTREMDDVKKESYIIAGTIGMLRWALTDIK